jgi:hypothetical protein
MVVDVGGEVGELREAAQGGRDLEVGGVALFAADDAVRTEPLDLREVAAKRGEVGADRGVVGA